MRRQAQPRNVTTVGPSSQAGPKTAGPIPGLDVTAYGYSPVRPAASR